MGFGITDIMILEATEAEIREQHKGLGRMIKSRKGNNFFANRQFTEITPEFTYTSWQGNFGIVDVPVKPKSPKKVPVIVLNSWRQTISQEIQGLRTGCRFKIKVVTDDRQGLSLNNDIEIIVDSVVLLKGTIEGGRRLFTAEFVAVK